MKTYLDCFPCFVSQALRAARMATEDEQKIKEVLDAVGGLMRDIRIESTPPESVRLIYHKISEITGNPDPYGRIKRESTQKSLTLYPVLKAFVNEADDRLLAAIKVAVAGNVIDFGVCGSIDIRRAVQEVLETDFAVCEAEAFRKTLAGSDEVLFLGDNAGETVFDRVLIEEIGKPVVYAVRGAPIINDVTYQDAVDAGLGQVATIVSSGTDAPGTLLWTCNEAFREMFRSAGCIVSKGQGNYESLSAEKRPLFFLLKCKCPVIARDIEVDEGDIVLLRGAFFHEDRKSGRSLPERGKNAFKLQ